MTIIFLSACQLVLVCCNWYVAMSYSLFERTEVKSNIFASQELYNFIIHDIIVLMLFIVTLLNL